MDGGTSGEIVIDAARVYNKALDLLGFTQFAPGTGWHGGGASAILLGGQTSAYHAAKGS